jgi:hypothetical protein
MNEFGGNALHEATAGGHDILLSNGASVNLYDFEQFTALS